MSGGRRVSRGRTNVRVADECPGSDECPGADECPGSDECPVADRVSSDGTRIDDAHGRWDKCVSDTTLFWAVLMRFGDWRVGADVGALVLSGARRVGGVGRYALR